MGHCTMWRTEGNPGMGIARVCVCPGMCSLCSVPGMGIACVLLCTVLLALCLQWGFIVSPVLLLL